MTKKPSITVEWQFITPDDAVQFLKMSRGNRTIKAASLSRMVDDAP